jgi:hypothetical protein
VVAFDTLEAALHLLVDDGLADARLLVDLVEALLDLSLEGAQNAHRDGQVALELQVDPQLPVLVLGGAEKGLRRGGI